ncbi:MAG: CatB-related O-acetyltransferase [Kiritimatiellaceae bacterium]|nr:CatB-related O-acetyltransferase [Kiritimatiellaceae bacterium]
MMTRLLKKIRKKYWNIKRKHSVKCEVATGTCFGRGCFVDAKSQVGSYTSINTYSIVTKTSIGNYCSIGNFVTIGPGEHDMGRISTSSIFYKNPYEELTQKRCVIGNDVWIGNFAFIRRGVTIGDGAVIGAHAVVTQDVPPFAIVAGVPARMIRMRFDEEKMHRIMASQWWNLPINEASRAVELLK